MRERIIMDKPNASSENRLSLIDSVSDRNQVAVLKTIENAFPPTSENQQLQINSALSAPQ